MKSKYDHSTGHKDISRSKGHKSQSAVLPSGRNVGQKSISQIEHNFSPAPGSPEPTQGRAR